MREIKFRAYLDYGDGNGERLPNVQNHINGDWAFGHMALGNVKNVSELMQYTGLKDKNGVEIYEGDIIQYKNTIEDGVAVIEDFCNCMCAVWKIQNTPTPSIFTALCYLGCSKEIETIGNIHENPELLEEE